MNQSTTTAPAAGEGRNTFIQFQYDDLAVKSQDLYASTKYEILESYLRDRSNMSILNVGCGSGELSLRLAALGHAVMGIDVEPAHIELARCNANRQGTVGRCEFAACGIEDFRSEVAFDCVVSTDMLEHIENDGHAFARMMDALKPHGLLLLAVPAGPWLFGYHDEQLGHFRRYTMKSLRNLVEPQCEIQVIRHFGFTLLPVCLLYSKWLRRAYPVAESADRRRRPFRALALRTLMRVDRWTRMPLGTSLLVKGIKRG